jgi:fatty acid hydroxylase domain-containing protein 2
MVSMRQKLSHSSMHAASVDTLSQAIDINSRSTTSFNNSKWNVDCAATRNMKPQLSPLIHVWHLILCCKSLILPKHGKRSPRNEILMSETVLSKTNSNSASGTRIDKSSSSSSPKASAPVPVTLTSLFWTTAVVLVLATLLSSDVLGQFESLNAAKSYIEARWHAGVVQYGPHFFSILMFVHHFGHYYTFGTLMSAIYYFQWPHSLYRYKIQDLNTPRPSKEKMWRLMTQVWFNQFVVGVPFGLAITEAYAWRGMFDQSLPTLPMLAVQLFGVVIVEEILFYYSHRILHHPKLYARIHKQHHEWISPLAWCCIYAHPIEHVVSNLFPIMIGPLIIGMHPLSALLWFAIAFHSTMNSHSGLHLPATQSPEEHDWHHLTFTEMYGVVGLLDWLHGTDVKWRQSEQYTRAKISFSLEPLVPEHKNWPAKKKT